jgi:hypothetical protein
MIRRTSLIAAIGCLISSLLISCSSYEYFKLTDYPEMRNSGYEYEALIEKEGITLSVVSRVSMKDALQVILKVHNYEYSNAVLTPEQVVAGTNMRSYDLVSIYLNGPRLRKDRYDDDISIKKGQTIDLLYIFHVPKEDRDGLPEFSLDIGQIVLEELDKTITFKTLLFKNTYDGHFK